VCTLGSSKNSGRIWTKKLGWHRVRSSSLRTYFLFGFPFGLTNNFRTRRMSDVDWDYHLSQCVVNSWLKAGKMPTSTAESCPKTCETESKVDLPKPSDCIDLRTLYSRGIQPVGLVRLDSICELEAHFSRNHYDGFFVRDSGPLRRAIQDVSPFCASRMKSDLHMTVRYPGIGQVPSMCKEDAEAFGQGSSFPPVRIFIRDIYLSKDRNLAAAVVYGIDTPVAATPETSTVKLRRTLHCGHSGGRQ
jgi:hypothetical protein